MVDVGKPHLENLFLSRNDAERALILDLGIGYFGGRNESK